QAMGFRKPLRHDRTCRPALSARAAGFTHSIRVGHELLKPLAPHLGNAGQNNNHRVPASAPEKLASRPVQLMAYHLNYQCPGCWRPLACAGDGIIVAYT